MSFNFKDVDTAYKNKGKKYAVIDKETNQVLNVQRIGKFYYLEDDNFISQPFSADKLISLLAGDKGITIELKSK